MNDLTKRERIAAIRIMNHTGLDLEKCFMCVRHARADMKKAVEMGSTDAPEGDRR